MITPINAFDLGGRAVQFTPSGTSYTVTSTSAAFDTNLGTKLDLTVAPAFNSTIAEPGDDAYILQDLGFSFSLYGASFSQAAVSSNGFLTFQPGGVSQGAFNAASIDSIESLADLQRSVPRIAPYWHDLDGQLGARRIQGLLNLSNILIYPDLPTTRIPFVGANHGLSIMGQEQGHRWMSYIRYPGADSLLLLGRDDAH